MSKCRDLSPKLAGAVLSTFLTLAGPPTLAQAPAKEQAVTRTADDPQLQWGPCPAFLPKGCQIAVLHGDPAKPNVDVFSRSRLIPPWPRIGTRRPRTHGSSPASST